jgi:subtilisin family serine protease
MKRISLLLLSVLLLALVPASLATAQPTTQLYTIVFSGNAIPANLAELAAAAGGEVILTIPEIGVAEVRATGGFTAKILGAVGVLAANPSLSIDLDDVKMIEADVADVVGRGDLYALHQWDIKRVTNNGASYAITTGNQGVVVGVIDTGVFPHPDLVRNLLGGRNMVPALGFGNDPTETGNPNDYIDRHGHGTHCAGTIAANGRCYGVGPDLGIRAYRALTRGGSGSSTWIVAGIVAAVNDGCRVISMSLGGFDVKGQVWWTDPVTGETFRLGNDVASYLAYQRAVEYATQHGTVVVAAAGNDSLNCTQKGQVTQFLNWEYGPLGYRFVGAGFESPGSIPGVICVSATDRFDGLSSYSNYGPGFIHLSGPGGDFPNWPNPGWWFDMCLNTYGKVNLNGTVRIGWSWMAGTSMATPKVAAVAALVAVQHPEYSAAEIEAALDLSAIDVGQSAYFGHGVVNAYTVLGGQ